MSETPNSINHVAILDGAINGFLAEHPGAYVVNKSQWEAIVAVPGAVTKEQHPWTHFFLAILTCGLYLLVWLVMATRKSKKIQRQRETVLSYRIRVFEDGSTTVQALGKGRAVA